jgi:tetratricopeptide (TPR) repeat protein
MRSFEERLSRATPRHRPQYLRIKASEILDQSDDPEAWDMAASLLRRVIDDYPDALDVPMAHVGLAQYHRRLSQWDEALRQYQLAIDLTSPRRSGSTGIEEVDMAEVLVERNAPGDNTRALELLASEHLLSQRHFNSTLFRIALCRARAQSRVGMDPSAAAREALRLASIAEPLLPRHPTVGLVDSDQQTLEELKRYGSG